MANSRFSITTKHKTQSSGISEQILPKVLQYPKFLPFGEIVKDIFCYIIRHYGHNGLAVLFQRQPTNDQVVVLCGDWYGNVIDLLSKDNELAPFANEFLSKHAIKFYELLRTIRVEQAQFYFAIVNNELVLVDVQISLNKMASPGMVNDVFGKIFPTQEVLKMEIIDERALEHAEKGAGHYQGDLVIKPSRFRMYEDKGHYQPLYAELIR